MWNALIIIKQGNLADQIALDGSYSTSKARPHDIDLAVLTPGISQQDGEVQYAAAGIDLRLLDIQFAVDGADFQQWLTFFSLTRLNSPKGVIILVF